MLDAQTLPRRWYMTPAGRVGRAAIGLGLLALAIYLFWVGGAGAVLLGVLLAAGGVSMPLAAVVQEPD